MFKILVVDFMHEIELGVWKALFTHLIRILYACDPSGTLVVTLNTRYVLLSPIYTLASTHTCQILADSRFWPVHYPPIWGQNVRDEESSCAIIRKPSSGM